MCEGLEEGDMTRNDEEEERDQMELRLQWFSSPKTLAHEFISMFCGVTGSTEHTFSEIDSFAPFMSSRILSLIIICCREN